MKHAYLILAHNEFDILKCLLQCLDDKRNDIFIHFDYKLTQIPELQTKYANLFIIENRIDVRWGDVSVVEAEYVLFEAASRQGSYAYYHLLSGVDMPLKSQDYIHNFFSENNGKEFIGFYQEDAEKEIDCKVNRFHLFSKYFRSQNNLSFLLTKSLRFAFLKFQYLFGIRRNKKISFKKGTQWISITDSFVKYVISKKDNVLKIYQNTFCSDEIFIQTLCWNSSFMDKIFNYRNEGDGCMRMIGWKDGVLYDWENKDYNILIVSRYLFARKFNGKNLEVVNRILQHVI
ncbi:beta-1,6-N-acetylglucosaminyltransferase [Elizabethkingia anophelis]|uniref:beta-1,6-N-acetylglucosaminyltransferase n=1 Tax=Elizabethkingia anophelis TaxID=1117645 RepID=UPI000442C947|nr:beta-1,6-N-acetylglucosaminyltransferase [Elizabethkingia anophelis]MCT4205499.1 glycosyl transferase [Elizabethkingia anophelis]MCT4209013.1 glycosyl transferase [Elizabethkingia anophelis]OPC46255.1 glycosyl transferase [Elizabethkingia anophelis]CDN75279.1 Glycosyltransferase [Elizabethkingia anophelis]CDN76958.1 Glycosyltransferase [Elizabethkingia anophelis]